ncbi:MAG: isopentenyl-diphosphate Delta-isomerase [archaeon]|nr:isopentenyl-diphosphate Delta-isomerase [archaeon]
MKEILILVDKNDKKIGEMEKIRAHKEARLHRAFSVFLFNSNGELMLQKRADSKYHSPGLWGNACDGHPRVNETITQAGERRLIEEMGITCKLKKKFGFVYKVKLDHGMNEHEFDYVLIGKFNGSPKLNKKEASDWKWIELNELKKQVKKNPENFTSWFKIVLKKYLKELNGHL